MRRQIDRRRLLQTTGAAGLLALAGCLGGDDDDANGDDTGNGDDENGVDDQNGDDDDTGNGLDAVETVAGFLTPDEDNETLLAYVDFEALQEAAELFDDLYDGEAEDIDDEIGDPLIESPTAAPLFVGFAGGFGVGVSGLSPYLEMEADREVEINSTVNEQFVANETYVLLGDIDTAEADDLLVDPPDIGGDFPLQPFEEIDEYSGYTLYQPVTEEEDVDQTIAVSDRAVIHGETRPNVERTIDSATGQGIRTVDEYDEFEWLLAETDGQDLLFGGYNPDGLDEEPEEGFDEEEDPLFELEETATGVMYSASFAAEDLEAKAAITFDGPISADGESLIRDELGTQASEVSYDFDGARVIITGTYNIDELRGE